MRSDQWNEARKTIMDGAMRLYEGVGAAERREHCASDAGAALAAEVRRYCEDPEGVGLGALFAAHTEFMQLHAANFVTSEAMAT